MAIYTKIRRILKLQKPNATTEVSFVVSSTAITDGVTATSEPIGSIAFDVTVPSLFISDGTHWVALATQSATPSFTTVAVSSTSTFTGAITASAGVLGPKANEDVSATNVILAAESGKVFFLNSATEFVSTLPAPAAGLEFTFIVEAAPVGASYTIVTNSSANIIVGQQHSAAGDAGDTGTADDTISFVDGQAVAGDMVYVISDGTKWYAYAFSKVAAGITFTQAS